MTYHYYVAYMHISPRKVTYGDITDLKVGCPLEQVGMIEILKKLIRTREDFPDENIIILNVIKLKE